MSGECENCGEHCLDCQCIHIHFKSVSDLRKRLPSLFIDQKEGECYNFTFEDEETEKEFDKIKKAFEEK
jgi:hypothetical protein